MYNFSSRLRRPFGVIVALGLFLSHHATAKPASFDMPVTTLGDPFYLLFMLVGIALLPFIAIMTTSFAKIVVVLSIARQAIGTPQAPPNIVLVSLALLFTGFAMYPVLTEIWEKIETQDFSHQKAPVILQEVANAAKEPLRAFLNTHAKSEDKELFHSLMTKKNVDSSSVTESDFIILAPAFLISELSLAFQIGFLIYLPFLVIDMTIANLLMALGMQMLAPTTISLPFKILLFVLVDGWRLLAEGLSRV